MKARFTGKYIAVIAAVLALFVVGAYSVNAVSSSDTQDYPPIIDKLVKAFNLDPAKVKEVFDQDRQERIVERKARYEEILNQAVKDGKLTEAQKAAILKKTDELQSKREAIQKEREELKKWADDNKIDLKWLRFGFGGPRGHRGFWGGPMPSSGAL